MLRIRREQSSAFAQEAVRGLECRIYAHLTRTFPAQCRRLGEVEVRSMIRRGLDDARRHGVEAEYDISRYVDLMFILGPGFDSDPGLPWASAVLADESYAGGTDRVDELCRLAGIHVRAAAEAQAPTPDEHMEMQDAQDQPGAV